MDPLRNIWFAFFVLASIMAGTVAGVLGWLSSRKAPEALIGGGAAFVTAMLLMLTTYGFLAGES